MAKKIGSKTMKRIRYSFIIIVYVLASAGMLLAQTNLQFKEGTLESPVPGGGTNKYMYRKGAFYGYADKTQKAPSWYNLSWEITIPKVSSGLQYSDKDIIQAYTITELHVICDFDEKGHGRWKNLNPAASGTISTGPIKSPTTGKIERIITSSNGSLLFHLAPEAKYFPRDEELTAVSKNFEIKTKPGGIRKHVMKSKEGETIATLDLEQKVIVAGPQGMNVKVDLPSGALEISEPFETARTEGIKR
jgi:hypothetical protein